MAMRKPASVVHSVMQELSQIGLRYCHSAPNTSGAGRMESGTLNSAQTDFPHARRAPIVNSHGRRRPYGELAPVGDGHAGCLRFGDLHHAARGRCRVNVAVVESLRGRAAAARSTGARATMRPGRLDIT